MYMYVYKYRYLFSAKCLKINEKCVFFPNDFSLLLVLSFTFSYFSVIYQMQLMKFFETKCVLYYNIFLIYTNTLFISKTLNLLPIN